MNFLMFIAVVVATVSANQNTVDPKMKAKVMELLTMDAKDMKHCMTDADCADSKDKPKCCDKMRLCGPADAHKMEMRSKDCTDHSTCPPMTKCHNKKCHFTGPVGCDSDSDCMQGTTGMTHVCKENAKSMPGKRCWAKCTTDSDCHNCDGKDGECRMPAEVREKIGCCQGTCQRKMTC